jgi:glucokinase
MSSDSLAIGLDLGGTQVRAALVDCEGRVLNRVAVLTKATLGADVVIGQLQDAARSVMRDCDSSNIVGIGLCAPGPLDTAAGVSLSMPTIAGFEGVKLRERLEDSLKLPVCLENDGTAAALGEWHFGAGQGLHHFVYITVSTGLGGGVIVDNRILRGRLGLAAEVGHMTIVRNGDTCSCGNRGCWEAYASGTAFIRRARARVNAGSASLLGSKASEIGGQTVFQAAALGDAIALDLIAEEAEYLGIGIANLLHLYSPQAIVVGGGMSANLDVLLPGICETVRRAAMKGFENIPIVQSALGGNSGLVGAAAMAFDFIPASFA